VISCGSYTGTGAAGNAITLGYEAQWVMIKRTDAEQEAEYKAMKDAEQATSVRQSRTEKLKDCDWTQLADSTADKAAWATHRQALRDITTQPGFPWTIEWPEQP